MFAFLEYTKERDTAIFKVARLALRGAAGRSATRPTQFGHYPSR
jgi:hypothetical protein